MAAFVGGPADATELTLKYSWVPVQKHAAACIPDAELPTTKTTLYANVSACLVWNWFDFSFWAALSIFICNSDIEIIMSLIFEDYCFSYADCTSLLCILPGVGRFQAAWTQSASGLLSVRLVQQCAFCLLPHFSPSILFLAFTLRAQHVCCFKYRPTSLPWPLLGLLLMGQAEFNTVHTTSQVRRVWIPGPSWSAAKGDKCFWDTGKWSLSTLG